MRIHIIGICGTFMGGIAAIAKGLGHEITGSDANVYPPMSTQLKQLGVVLFDGFSADNIQQPDIVIVGNAISRGNPELEAVLNQRLPYTSGPQWLADHVLVHKQVLAVSGTHGKTSTTSMLAWILEVCGQAPSFLIGGVAENFGQSARIRQSPYFVIEADEYDSAFFDKRSKFLHYRPNTLILNNLEFDHADIFKDLAAIQTQFQYLLRTIPANGTVISNAKEPHLETVINKGCWTPVQRFNSDESWQLKLLTPDASQFKIFYQAKLQAIVEWSLMGEHNASNALAAILAAHSVGISIANAAKALKTFKNVKRRLECKGEVNGAKIYDDFAHHPTAIKKTLSALRSRIGGKKLIAIVEFGSYTMRSGAHSPESIATALTIADEVYLKQPKEDWGIAKVKALCQQPVTIFSDMDSFVKQLQNELKPDNYVLVMSNSGFDNIFQKLIGAEGH